LCLRACLLSCGGNEDLRDEQNGGDSEVPFLYGLLPTVNRP
jgi:hypothetical protein